MIFVRLHTGHNLFHANVNYKFTLAPSPTCPNSPEDQTRDHTLQRCCLQRPHPAEMLSSETTPYRDAVFRDHTLQRCCLQRPHPAEMLSSDHTLKRCCLQRPHPAEMLSSVRRALESVANDCSAEDQVL